MTDPKTPQELNEAVAKRLGFDSLKDAECAWYDYNGTGITGLDFTDDPAAAVWAMERLDKHAFVYYTPKTKTWMCVADYGKDYVGTFCEVICRAIAGTGG